MLPLVTPGFVPVLLATVAALALTGAPVGAAVFVVDSTVDEVDANPGDGVCATAAGECTLRGAVAESNALPGADSITLLAGDFAAGLEIRDSIAITGAGSAGTVVNGDFDIRDSEQVMISDLTITAGRVLAIDTGLVRLERIRINGRIDHSGVFGPSGVYALEATVHIVDSAVEDLTGDIFWGVRADIFSKVVIERSTVQRIAAVGIGGYISTVIVRDSRILDNDSIGIVAESDGSLRIERSTVSGNANVGIAAAETSLDIVSSTISNNGHADSDGGGLLVAPGTAANLLSSTVSGNRARRGGGILEVSSSLSLVESTVVDNRASEGGGIFGEEGYNILDLERSIVARNTAALGPDCGAEPFDAGYGFRSRGSNLIGDLSGCDFEDAPGDQIGSPESPLDPLLGPLADNGGPTSTHAILPGSPARDTAGDCLNVDQRGITRPQGPACDIGAVEFADCDASGVDDGTDIAQGLLMDADGDLTPDVCADVDGDGVGDPEDVCLMTAADEAADRSGCSIAQLCPCDGPFGSDGAWRSRGRYLSCIVRQSRDFFHDGLITRRERRQEVTSASRSTCGRRRR